MPIADMRTKINGFSRRDTQIGHEYCSSTVLERAMQSEMTSRKRVAGSMKKKKKKGFITTYNVVSFVGDSMSVGGSSRFQVDVEEELGGARKPRPIPQNKQSQTKNFSPGRPCPIGRRFIPRRN
jgi:hypothetical protein